MKREAYQKLLDWKKNPDRKPLIIQGARQVGKTWLMKTFGEQEFQQTAYFNFESTKVLHQVFKQGYDISTIISSLNILAGFQIGASNTLIILDEIQACPDAITALKYFQENNPEYHIFAAGSLLGVAIHQGISFPVGKVDFLTLHPMNFPEFMAAMGKEDLIHAIDLNQPALMGNFHDECINLLKQYLFVGGMPEVVKTFAQNKNYHQVQSLQMQILNAYENDFSKHAPVNQLPRIRMVWQSIVGQLAKENSKFIYSVLRTGSRAKDFELAIEWLKDAGLIQKVIRVSKPALPIAAYADWSDFKIYLNDVGLMCAMAGISPEIILNGNGLFIEFKGILAEQFVLQQFISKSIKPFYWAPEHKTAEVDFLIQQSNRIMPIEVKSAENVKSRSLRVYYDQYLPEQCIRTSLAPYQKQDWMTNIPLYAIHILL
jgi:predicted AAA+ superfamily ATPase